MKAPEMPSWVQSAQTGHSLLSVTAKDTDDILGRGGKEGVPPTDKVNSSDFYSVTCWNRHLTL